MSDNSRVIRYGGIECLQSIDDESESDIGSRSTSSTLSWTDEAEREISEEMKNQYELFESALYSELDGEELPEPLQEEVAIWKQHSPHLRIVGSQITPTFNEIEERYPEDYEEIFIEHFDPEDISFQFKEHCSVSKNTRFKSEVLVDLREDDTFENLASETAENNNIISAENQSVSPKVSPKNENKSFLVLENSLQVIEHPIFKGRRAPLSSRSCLNRHEYKCNHITEYEESTDQGSNNQTVLRQRRLSPARIQRRNPSSSYSANRASRRVSTATSAKFQSRKSLVSDSTPKISQLAENPDRGSVRHGILPPLQAIPITPKPHSKRANSAMIRFTKTLPRTRPNTSKNQALLLTPIEDYSDIRGEHCSVLEILPHADGHLSPLVSSLPYCSNPKPNKRVKIPRRWRY